MRSRELMALAVLLLLPVLSWGRTWRVEKDGSGDFTVIQAAVDAAASGDTVRIGPGRYEEYAPHDYSGTPYNICVYIDGKDLTLIGAGEENTTIGYLVDMSATVRMGIKCRYGQFRIVGLRIMNVEEGINVSYGTGEIEECELINNTFGVYTSLDGTVTIANCSFVDNDDGVWTYSGSDVTHIVNCDFTSSIYDAVGVEAQSRHWTQVEDSRFHGLLGGVQYSFLANGRVEGCVFEDCESSAVDVTDSSMLDIVNCQMSGGVYCILCERHGGFTGTGNTLIGGTEAVVRSDNGVISMNDSVFRNAPGGLLMKLGFYWQPPLVHLDFTHNDWGYDDPDSIAALIWDGNDDPSLYGVVDFEPFNAPQVANEDVSWGDVKIRYR